MPLAVLVLVVVVVGLVVAVVRQHMTIKNLRAATEVVLTPKQSVPTRLASPRRPEPKALELWEACLSRAGKGWLLYKAELYLRVTRAGPDHIAVERVTVEEYDSKTSARLLKMEVVVVDQTATLLQLVEVAVTLVREGGEPALVIASGYDTLQATADAAGKVAALGPEGRATLARQLQIATPLLAS